MARAKRKLPAKPAGFVFPQHRDHFCPVIRYPNTKPPPPTIHTPQKPHGPIKRHRPVPEHKKTRCRSEHRRPFSFLRTTAVTSAAVIRYPNTPPPPPTTIHTPQKPHGPVKQHRPMPEHKKPAAAPNTAGRFHFSAPPRSLLPRHPIPEHKAPAADNTHPTKTSRLGQTAPTDTRTQKNPLPLRTPPAVSAFSKKTAALPKCHSSAPTTAGRRTTPPHTT